MSILKRKTARRPKTNISLNINKLKFFDNEQKYKKQPCSQKEWGEK
jgi:hypothetical protein